MSDLATTDARARERALEAGHSFIVQAPAGAGKTELLIRRFLALLATVDEPEAILAITFTRKAAAEMRDRVLAALGAAGRPQPDPAMHARTLELARAALRADAARGWRLLEHPGRLRILTIDALNLGLARRLPLLGGLGAGIGIEEDPRELYREAAERLLEHLPSGQPEHARAVASLLRHVDNRVERFVELVIEMLMRREAWLPVLPGEIDGPSGEAALRARLEASRSILVHRHLQALQRSIAADLLTECAAVAAEAARRLVADGRDSPITAWSGAATAPGDALQDVPLWQGLAQLLLTEAGSPRSRFDVRLGIPPGEQGGELKQRAGLASAAIGECPAAMALLHAVRRLPPARYDADEWEVLLAEFRVLRLAAAELELVFAARRRADYPRFAAAARQALGSADAPTDTALALDARLEHVLVDEFQDTSEAQVRLLEALTAGWQPGDGRTLFLVGDPMQSIYRFRNAEVGLFIDVRDHGLGGPGGLPLEPLTLAVNFRSTEPVIAWVNDCFRDVFPVVDDVLRGAVSYAPSVPRTGAGAGGGVVVHAMPGQTRPDEAGRVVDIVEAELAADADARIGILVQGRSHLVEIVAELATRRVPFRATDIDPLGGRPAVLDLLSLTRALAHLADRGAWLASLRAPWCGLSWSDLHALVGDERRATIAELLVDPLRRARLGGESRERLERTWGVLAVAQSELPRLGLRDTVERAWNALGGPATLRLERELDEVEAFLGVLADLEADASRPVDPSRLARALEKLYAPSREHAGVRVELLTVHKAKGLQYDTVIVPGLDRLPRSDDRRLLHWIRWPDDGEDRLVVAPVERKGGDANPLYGWLESLEAEKLLQERRRLLYVAATRAKRWLHLLGGVAVRHEDGRAILQRPAARSALGLLWPTVGSAFVQQIERAGVAAASTVDAPAAPRDPPLRRLPPEWRAAELPAGPELRARSLPSSTTLPPVEFDWATETARHVGTVVHRELQRRARDGDLHPPADAGLHGRWQDELAELGVPPRRRAAAVARVARAVGLTLSDPRGRWLLDAGHRSSVTELALTGRLDGDLVRVVIDRTFIDTDGIRWIADYKSSSHEGAGLEEFLDQEQERYRPQLERYAGLMRRLGPEPVRMGLYFPLLRAWREWPLDPLRFG